MKKLKKMGKKPKKLILIPFMVGLFITGVFMAPVNKDEGKAENEILVEQKVDNENNNAAFKENKSEKESIIKDEVDVLDTIEPKVEDKVTDSVNSELKVHFIDVGQGNATLIICEEHAMLIDAGDNDKGTSIQLYLTKQGVKKLDYVIGTHPDADHIGGLDVILYKFDCDTIIMPDYAKDAPTYDDVMQTMKSKNYVASLPVVGATYKLGSAIVTIIAPNEYYSDENNSSVGILLSHGENTFLFTGDAEEGAEADILNNGISIDADVYQAGHHGSRTSSNQNFLNAVTPIYAVISCGEDNTYGYPHAEVLNNFRSMGVEVFRTDEQGSIIATSDGDEITWNCSPSESWQAGEPTGEPSIVVTPAATASGVTAATITDTTPVIEQESPKADEVSITTTYVLNTNTLKFHYPTCGSVSQMKEKNKQEVTLTRDEIIAMGYVPCKNCNP